MITQYTLTERAHTCQVCTLAEAMKQCHACQFYTQPTAIKASVICTQESTPSDLPHFHGIITVYGKMGVMMYTITDPATRYKYADALISAKVMQVNHAQLVTKRTPNP